jgi:alanine dehydrogenase
LGEGLMLVLNNDDLARVLPMRACIDILEEGFRDIGAGRAVDTGRTDVYTATPTDGLFHRSSILRGANRRLHVNSVRIMSDMVTWPHSGDTQTEEKYCVRPGLFCGLVMLFDTENGEPLALLNDGYLQHLTVGAGAGIGAKYLAKRESAILGVIGSGGQARAFTDAICAVRPIKRIRVYSPTAEHRRAFADLMRQTHEVDCEPMDNPRDACTEADVVITATDAVVPVFDADWIPAGAHFTSVNADEIDHRIFDRADVIASIYFSGGSDASGPSEAPLRLVHNFASWAVATEDELKTIPRRPRGAGRPEKTVSLLDIMLNRRLGRTDDRQITLCQGGGPQRFTAVFYAAYQMAKDAGLGSEIPTDWLLQTIRD